MYNTAWERASAAAARPFQRYSNDPNAFVAGLTPTQQQAISQAGATMGAYQPYYGAAAGLTGAAGTTSTADVVGQYMSPFVRQVVDPVRGALEQQQAIQRQQQKAEQIKAGQFGQQRGQQERALLAGQQNLGLGQALSPLYQTGYGQALGAAQGDLARMLQAGGQYGQLGTGAQQAAATGVQTGLAAGQAQQQTEQAGKTALYNQFMQEQAYPFLTSQFLTQAAQGIGPGYGSTTSGVQQSLTPLSYWGNPLSDSRVKEGVEGSEAPEPIATTPTGKTIYRYRKINPETGELGPVEFGMMADERAEDTPDAVGQRPDGLLTLDYKRASDDDAEAMARMGGAVTDGGDYAEGGSIPYGDVAGYLPIGGVSPMSPLSSPSLSYMSPEKRESKYDFLKSGLSDALNIYKAGKGLYGDYKEFTKKAAGGYVPESGVRPMNMLQGPSLSYNRDEDQEGESTLGKIGSGVKSVAGLAGAAKSLMDIGTTLAPFVMSLSDPRVKTGVRPAARDGMGIRTGAPDVDETTTEDVEETPRGGFDEAVKQTLRFEGGLNPNDAGKGPSMRGINQAAHPGIDVTKLTEPQTRDIYYNEYWKGVGADQLPADVRNIVYDTAVMAGPRRAKQLLEVAGTDPDKYMAAREKFLNNLVAANPEKYGPYAKSWANRNAALRSGAGLGTGDVDEVLSNLPLGARRWQASTPTVDERGFGERLADKFTQNPEQFIIPVLAGLGTMASSGSRFLGPSILQGIGGGAKAYAEMAQQQFEREKMGEELGLRKGELGLKGRATDVAERELGIKEREQKRKLDAAAAIAKALQGGAGGVPYGSTPPAGGAPADVRPPAAKTSELAPTGEAPTGGAPVVAKDPVPAPNNAFWANVDPQSNPHILDATAQRFENAAVAAGQAGDPEYAKSLLASAQQYRTAASSIRKEGRILTNRGEVALIPGFGEAAADVKRMEAEAEAGVRVPTEQQIEENKAKISRKYAPVVSPTGTKYMPPEDETASPPVTAPIAPPEGRPTSAAMEPKSGRLNTAIPPAPQGGGMMIDPSLPPGAKVAELSPQNAAIVENDKKFFGDFMERMPATETALQRYKNIAQALKIAESGSTADQRLAFSTLAATMGYQDLAEKVSQGDPAAMELVKKNALNAVLDTLKAATPRFAQQEFTRLSDQGVPSPDRLPRTNFEMTTEAIGTLERQKAFARDWSQAQKEGWVSPTSFWQSWSEANPLDTFVKAAGRQLGNFRGMPLPPAKDWAEGAIYVVPSHLAPAQAAHMGRKGLKPGDMFMFGGWGEGGDPVMRPISKSEAYSAHRGVQ